MRHTSYRPTAWVDPRGLTIQLGLLLLLVAWPVLLAAEAWNDQADQALFQDQARQITAAHAAGSATAVAAALLREWDGLTALRTVPALYDRTAAPSGAARDAAGQQAYARAGAADPVRQAYVSTPAAHVLQAFQAEAASRAVAVLAGAQGELLASTSAAWPYADLAGQSWWTDAMMGGVGGRALAYPVDVPGFGPLVMLAVAVVDARQQPVGVVAVGWPAAALQTVLDGVPDGAHALVVARDGTVIARGPRVAAQPLPRDDLALLQGGSPAARPAGSYLAGYAPVAGPAGADVGARRTLQHSGWMVVHLVPAAEALTAAAARADRRPLRTLPAAVALAVLAGLGVYGRVVRPLRRLEALLVAGGAGPTAPRHGSEIGRVARAGAHILGSLRTLAGRQAAGAAREAQTIAALHAAARRLSRAAAEQEQVTLATNAVLAQVLEAFAALDNAATAIADHAQKVAVQATTLKYQYLAGEAAIATTATAFADLQRSAAALEQGAAALATDARAASVLIDQANDVAETTHTLSLNAMLESAAAGAVGTRFGIIAAEVRQLSTVAARTAGSMDGTLQRMTEQTQQTAQATHRARMAVDHGAQQVQVLNQMMAALLDAADDLTMNAHRIRQRSTEQRNHSHEVHQSSHQLASAMQQVTLASREVADQAQALLALASLLGTAPDDSGAAPDPPVRPRAEIPARVPALSYSIR